MVWAFVGAALLGVSYLVARPTFSSAGSAPRPWRLWLSTDARTPNEDAHSSPAWLLRLNGVSDGSCSNATVTGALEWRPKEVTDPVRPTPTRYVIAIAEAEVLRLETRSMDPRNLSATEAWQTTPLHRVSGAEVAEVPVAHWQGPSTPAEFRLTLAAIRPAGFRSCYVTSPSIDDFYEAGNAVEAQPDRVFSVSTFLEGRKGPASLDEPLYLDAIVENEVSGQEPQDLSAPAHLTSHPRAAISTCTTYPTEGHGGELDSYRADLNSRASRPCAGVQVFRSSSLQATLTQYGFWAGLIASAGMAILIEALVTGVTASASVPVETGKRLRRS